MDQCGSGVELCREEENVGCGNTDFGMGRGVRKKYEDNE